MDNNIYIDVDEIMKLPDSSIKDPETIRQISMYSIENNDKEIIKKIDKRFEVCGLYPYIMQKLDILPEDMSDEQISYMQKISEQLRKNFKEPKNKQK